MPLTLSPTVVREFVSPPADLADYLRQEAARGRPVMRQWKLRGGAAWLSWAIDGLLTLFAAVAMVVPATRLPYCNACRSWYRTIRGGRVPQATAQWMAAAAGIEMIDAGKWLDHPTVLLPRRLRPDPPGDVWDSPGAPRSAGPPRRGSTPRGGCE